MGAFDRLCTGACLLIILAPAASAAATPESAAAEKLFMEARALLAKGDYAAACPMLAESHRLEPGVGTLLNLAECYEAAGKTASAWVTYREMETLALRQNQAARAEHAAARARALEPSLAYVTLVVPSSVRVDGLVVQRDGGAFGVASWDRELPVDPGPHEFVVVAPSRRRWSASLKVEPRSRARVVVPLLRPVAMAATPSSGQPSGGGGGSALRSVGITALVAGGASLATGLTFGGIAWRKNETATRDHCGAADCDGRGVDLIHQSRTFATVATVTVIAGAATMAVGTLLWILAPRSSGSSLRGGRTLELTF